MEIGVDAFVELQQDVKHIRKHTRDVKPVRKPVGVSITIPAVFTAPVMAVIPQVPSMARQWNILMIGVFGADAHTAVTNVTADVYSGALPDPSLATLSDVILSAQPVPSINHFSRLIEWCEPNESIFMLLFGTGLAAGQNYELVARVAEYNVHDIEAREIP